MLSAFDALIIYKPFHQFYFSLVKHVYLLQYFVNLEVFSSWHANLSTCHVYLLVIVKF